MKSLSFDTLQDFVGKEIGISDWVDMPQSRIDAFAQSTEDRQWIHLDVARAQRESPFGTTIAHGFLTLSLLPAMTYPLLASLNAARWVNYGIDRLRFVAPVRAGARVRNHIKLLSAEPRDGRTWLLRTENTMEIEGEEKPALVAVCLALISPP
ncbi:MAG TPA: MaoC family dehydratase [Burkholderiaceae bacterium]|nr:MaoC family dehydratase [Burkholderiaceae bacterium]